MNLFEITTLAIGGIFAAIGIFRPFIGLCVLILIHFIQPGEMVPWLDKIRLELSYGVLILAIFIFKTMSSNRLLLDDPILRALLKFMLVAILTIPGSFWIGGSVTQFQNLIKIAIFVFLMKGLIELPNHIRAVMWLQVTLIAWFAGSGLWSFAQGDAYQLYYSVGHLQRAQGVNSIAGGANELAGLLVALLPYLVALFQIVQKLMVRLLLLGLAGLSIWMIVLAGSRIAMLSLIAIALFYVLRSKRKLLSAALVATIAFATWKIMPVDYQKRYLTVETYAEGGKLDDSNELRLLIWKAGWKMFLDHPILGVGLGQFPTAFGTKYSGVEHGAWMNPHNLLLQVLCETGLIGLFFYGNFIWQIFKANKILRRFTGKGADSVRAVAAACDATLLGVVVLSCVSHTMLRPYWYFVAGLVAANTTVAAKLRSEFLTEPESLAERINPVAPESVLSYPSSGIGPDHAAVSVSESWLHRERS